MPPSVLDLARLAEQRDDPGGALAAVAALRDRLDDLERLQVEDARRLGWSWAEIAEPLGISRQAVHHKHARRFLGATPARRRGGMTVADIRHSVARARREAAALGHDSVGTDHLLLDLLEHQASSLLDELAIKPEELREAVAQRRGGRGRPERAPELSGEAAAALDRALREATRAPAEGIRAQQLLVELLRDEESSAAQVLAGLGISTEGVERSWRAAANVRTRP